MQLADLVVVTGSQANVRAGYSSGTPALGVGAGNVVTIIDETADIDAAAEKIAASKIFDNSHPALRKMRSSLLMPSMTRW